MPEEITVTVETPDEVVEQEQQEPEPEPIIDENSEVIETLEEIAEGADEWQEQQTQLLTTISETLNTLALSQTQLATTLATLPDMIAAAMALSIPQISPDSQTETPLMVDSATENQENLRAEESPIVDVSEAQAPETPAENQRRRRRAI